MLKQAIVAVSSVVVMFDYRVEQMIEAGYENRPSPLAGTYRVVYRIAAGDSSVFFVLVGRRLREAGRLTVRAERISRAHMGRQEP